MTDSWIVWFPFALFFAWLMFFGMGQPKPCPDCGQTLSRLQSPFLKTRRQWFEGGYICRNCGCETDLKGQKVAPGTPPSRRSIVLSVVRLTLAVIPAIFLLRFILSPPPVAPPPLVAPKMLLPDTPEARPAPPERPSTLP